MSLYLPPGQPPPPPLPARANTYLPPTAVAQQLIAPPTPSPRPPQDAAGNGHDDPHNATLLAEWRTHHAGDWVRADALHPAIRRMIDPQERTPAVRQRLRQLVAHTPELETKTVGNRANRVVLYRVTGIKTAGVEG